MFAWILALVLALVAWSAAAAYLWMVRRRQYETRKGLAALAALPWRDFAQTVKRKLQDKRGWQELPSEAGTKLAGGDFVMQEPVSGAHWVIACKHGSSYSVSVAAVNELGAAVRLSGASGGLLITEGQVKDEAFTAAERQSIEIIDGRRLWPAFRPYLPAQLEARVLAAARRRTLRQIALAGLAALTVGLLAGFAWLSLHSGGTAEVAPAAQETPVSAPASDAATPPASSAQDVAPGQLAIADDGELDTATLDRMQLQVSKTLAGAPGVVRGIWQTRNTLVVDRTADDAAVWPVVCGELEKYTALRTVRVQLNPRPGVAEPTRWRQCQRF